MVERVYVPGTGEIVWLTFTPQAGYEQPGRRPALVLSPRSYNERTGLALFCSIAPEVKGYPFEVVLPTAGSIAGVILADQVKSLDWQVRRIRFECRAPPQVVGEVLGKLTVLLAG